MRDDCGGRNRLVVDRPLRDGPYRLPSDMATRRRIRAFETTPLTTLACPALIVRLYGVIQRAGPIATTVTVMPITLADTNADADADLAACKRNADPQVANRSYTEAS